jgi:spermidine synthase
MFLNKFALFLIGFSATSAQIILLREFISTFHGNELVIGIYLSVWLLATALGSGVLGRLVSSGGADTAFAVRFGVVQCLAGASLLFALVGLSLPPDVLRPAPGETTGLLAALACAGLFLAPFCLLQGLLFPLGTGLLRSKRPDVSVSQVYFLEAVGAALGGLLLSLLLIHALSSFQNAAIICAANLFMAGLLLEKSSRRFLRHGCTLLAAVALVVCVLDPVTLWITSRKWGAFDVVDVRQSRYGKLAVISIDSQFSVYQDGLLVFTSEDERSAEEAAHLSLLQHPSPTNVLLIGGGIGGVASEVLKHRELQRLDYVELDPELIALSKEALPKRFMSELDDPRLRVHLTDGRRFLGRSSDQYDVIIMQIPPPYTAQLNRFYTREFFTIVRDRLGPGGVFVFSAPGAAEYMGDDLSTFLGSLAATAEKVFGRTTVIPAGRSFFVSSGSENAYVTARPESLLSRLAARDIETLYVRDYFLLSSLAPERLDYVQERMTANMGRHVNADLRPTSFYYDLVLWSAEYERLLTRPLKWLFHNSWSLWAVVLGMAATLLTSGRRAGRARSIRRQRQLVLSALAVSGFAAIVLELEIILSFQLLYGGLYERIGVLLTSYMVGLAVGIALERRNAPPNRRILLRPALIQIGTAVFAACFFGTVHLMAGMRGGGPSVLELLYPLFAVVAGAFGGALFSSASRAFFQLRSPEEAERASPCEGIAAHTSPEEVSTRDAGLTYAWDLLGSWIGAAVCSVLLLPIVGVGSTTSMVAVLLAASGVSLVLGGLITRGR